MECPKCRSKSVHAQNRGFDAGKAVAGGLVGSLLGPLGTVAGAALGGTSSQNEVELVCLDCGHKFKPGDKPREDFGGW